MVCEWERVSRHRVLSRQEIDRVLAPLGVEPRSARRIDEGKSNTNFVVTLVGGGRVVLRAHSSLLVGELESAATARVADRVPVARVLLRDPDLNASVLEWKPGTSMERLIARGDHLAIAAASESIGRAAAAISAVHLPCAGFLDPSLTVVDPWPTPVAGYMGYSRQLLTSPLLRDRFESAGVDSLRRLVDDAEPRLIEVQGSPCLVHGDFKASNLLIHDGELSAVLDWEFCHSGTWLFNIAQLFRHPLPAEFRSGFERGFGTLPDDWPRLARALDLVNMLDFASREDVGPTTLRDVTRLVGQTVERWQVGA